MLQVVSSTSAAARVTAALRFLRAQPSASEVIIVAASRGAADDLVRLVAREAGATFGIFRFSLIELAARTAATAAIGDVRAPGSQAAADAMAARSVFDATAAGELEYFAPVAGMPGFPRALSRTLHELRLAGVDRDRLAVAGPAGRDLQRLLERVEGELERASIHDRAELLQTATEGWRNGRNHFAGLPVVLLDVTIDSQRERDFVGAIAAGAPAGLATVPDGDVRALEALRACGATVTTAADPADPASDLLHLRTFIFNTEQAPPRRARAGDVRLFSAPGEGREAVEIVRRVLDEAAAGVPFDEMGVFLRTPAQYLGLLEHACARADVPVYFDRGTRRPDPAGRAFVALVSCAVEGLSAKRFDEYLSLGQVPRVGARQAADPQRAGAVVPPRDEVFASRLGEMVDADDPESAPPAAPRTDSDEDAIVSGTLRSPWKWEELIVESAVVGGRTREDGKARWRRRLDGLAADYQLRIAELRREEPEAAAIDRFRRDLKNLTHLRGFALPIIDRLADWPDSATWGEWIAHLSALASAALVRPDRVLQTLADLRPMAAIGPVTLEQARDVLRDRLVTLDWDPPVSRYGKLFVGTPHQARGRRFRIVFVPGLAERVVPQRPREDPLLLDDRRRQVDPQLLRQNERSDAERLLLKIALGAADERIYVSYPRMDVAETRARVPSFYALDVMRAITGQVPDHRALAAEAAEAAGANLAWPAPADPRRAIDDLEHDLAVLKPLLDARDSPDVRGRAHYMLGLNDALRRSVVSRWSRGRTIWTPSDGLVKVSPNTKSALAAHRLNRREYSLSALQRFSTCPYQFLLSTIHRLQPWEEPEPLMRMDPLTRGSLFHEIQAGFLREMDVRGELPITPDAVPSAIRRLDAVVDATTADYKERLAPAIERVWNDEVRELRRDLGIWVDRMALDATWIPTYFEFSFGLPLEGRDPRSLREPIEIDGRFRLHGSVDLIERHAQLDVLRVTDHKTGRNRSNPDLIVGGGKFLQPVLYSVAIEQGLGKKVMSGRLYYCTTAGGFSDKPIDVNDYTRAQGLKVLEIVDRAVEDGFLVAAPDAGSCRWCDFRAVCGPHEEQRIKRKPKDRTADLEALRSMR